MVKLKLFSLSFIFWLSILSASGQDLQEVPKLWTRVTDLTSTLSSEEIQSIEYRLEQLEKNKGSQIVVLIVPTTGPEPIEDYSIRVVDEWKLGREGVDDGILLLIAKNDRKLRIEVGYGLEGAVTDFQSKRIIEDYITPNFKQGNFYGGITEGVDALASLVNGEELPEPTGYSNSSENDSTGWFFLIFIIAIIAQAATSKMLGKWKSKGLGIGIAFVGGLILGGLFTALFITFITFIMSVAGSGSGGGGYRGGGGWSSGSGSSWSSGGGGFSGGGGSFGGGGASGSW